MREDGVYHYLVVNRGENITAGNAGHCSCHVGAAFASFDAQPSLNGPDFVVAAGDMSVGIVHKVYLALPRTGHLRLMKS